MQDALIAAYQADIETIRTFPHAPIMYRARLLNATRGAVMALEHSLAQHDLREVYHAGLRGLAGYEALAEELHQEKSRYRQQMRAGDWDARHALAYVDAQLTPALHARDRLGELVAQWREELARLMPEEEWIEDGEILVEVSRVAS